MKTYVLRDRARGYFRGLFQGEDVVWTWEQSRALRFRDRDMAELAMVGHAPDATVVRLTKRSAPEPCADSGNASKGGE